MSIHANFIPFLGLKSFLSCDSQPSLMYEACTRLSLPATIKNFDMWKG